MNKFIVTGEMRSGTTFMANFLNTQEEIICYADFLRTPFLLAHQFKIQDFRTPLTPKERNILYSSFKANCDTFGLTLYRGFNQGDFYSINDFLELAFSTIAKNHGEFPLKSIGIKMTKYPEMIFKLLDLDYKIIYLLRDPRDVVWSSKNRFANFNVAEVICRWKKADTYIENFKNNPNFILISFEKFITKDEEVMNLLEKELSVKLNLDLQSLTMRSQTDYINNSSFSDVTQLFDNSAINRWKKNKEDIDVILANFMLKKELEKYKLEKMESGISIKEKWKFYGKFLKYKFRENILKYLFTKLSN